MRKINVRSPFYVDAVEFVEDTELPEVYYYYSVLQCGVNLSFNVKHVVELTPGMAVKIMGWGDTCFEVVAQVDETNENEVNYVYDTCNDCLGVPDYNYYQAELCEGGSPINVRTISNISVGQVVKVAGYSDSCYTITGAGTENTNDIITFFNNCDHCSTGIDYKYYDANECDGASSIVVRYEGTLPANRSVINVSGQGNKCFELDGESTETSTNDIVQFYDTCDDCKPVDPFKYYTATECGGSATVDFKSNETLAIGSSVTLDGYGTTCYEVTSVGSVSGVAWTNKYTDCTACANANDPYNYFDAQKCDGTGAVIKVASTGTLDAIKDVLWKANGQDDNCFTILSQTTGGGTFYYLTESCPTCPKDDPYKYYKATKCSGSGTTYFRSREDMAGKTVKIGSSSDCYAVNNEVFTTSTNEWSSVYSNCSECEASNLQANLKDVNLLTFYENNNLSGKTISQLDSEFQCLPCSDAVQYTTVKALTVPMNVGHQVYNADGTKNTSLNGHFASISTQYSSIASICKAGAVVFPVLYSFSNGVVTYAKAGTANQCYKLPTTAESVTLNCGASHYQGADAGRKMYNVYSSGVGDFTITVTGDEVPCKFVLRWNGSDQVDTGYIGSNKYDAQLLAAGVPGNDINTGATSTKNATLTFEKTLAYPNLVQLEVYSPLVNDEYTVTVTECPPLQTPTFASNSYVNIKGIFRLYNGYFLNEYSPYKEVEKTYDPFENGSLAECLQSFYNGNAYTFVFKNSRVFGQTSNDSWLRSLCPVHSFYSAALNHYFLDYSGEYNLDNSSGIRTWKNDIQEFRDDLSKRNLENTYIIIYIVDPNTTSSEAITSYNRLLQLINTLITQTGEMGLKDVYDAGRLKIVYNVENNRPLTYYRDLMAEQMNALNIGFNLNCG
jgi:hypothetical protein